MTKIKTGRFIKTGSLLGKQKTVPVQVQLDSADELILGDKHEELIIDGFLLKGAFLSCLDYKTLLGTIHYDLVEKNNVSKENQTHPTT